MDQVVLFAFLGIGAGSAYALTGLGLVAIHKGSSIVNFAQGAFAMVSAFCFTAMTKTGIGPVAALFLTVAGAAIAGAVLYALVIRPLRGAAALAQVVACIGLLVVLDAMAELLWNRDILQGTIAPSLLPTSAFRFAGALLAVNRLWLLGLVVVLVPLLAALYRLTTFGLATRAAAENERGAALLGYSPDLVAAGNWAIGSALAALAGIMIAPISALDVTSLTFTVLPALAAAMSGRFTSFAVTAVAGVVIGIGESLVTRYWSLQGVSSLIPLLVVIAAVIVNGRRIQQRGTVLTGRPPLAGDGRIRPVWLLGVPAVIVVLLALTGAQYDAALITSMIATIFALSLVVVTGFVGQVNLAPLAFAAIGAFGASIFGYDLGVPFPIPILLAALVAVPVGVIIGLPALRIRGISLAVVTLGAGVVMDNAVFQNYTVSGGQTGRPLPSPRLFGLSLDAGTHPVSFGIFTLVVMGVLMVLVSRVRRGALGRRMLAVRGNERAAAAAGISVAGIKLIAFGMSAFIAAVGGAVLAYQFDATAASNFNSTLSLTLVAVAFIGGIASVSGALQAGVLTSGGLLYLVLNNIPGISTYWTMLTGALLIATVVTQPDGIAVKNMQARAALGRRLRSLSSAAATEPAAAPIPATQPVPAQGYRGPAIFPERSTK